jgi:hypothetical protein
MNMSSVPAAASATNIRDRFLGFIDRHEVAWELTFATLAIVYVIVGFVDESAVTTGIEATLTAVFVAEFTTRIAASYDRAAYLRRHWIDLVALIPTTRALRVARLLRLLRPRSSLCRHLPCDEPP